MELLIIFVILIPVVGFALDLYGIGISKHASLILPGLTFAQAKVLLLRYAKLHHWRLIEKQEEGEERWYVLQVGKWGGSLFGSQRVTIIYTTDEKGILCTIYSRSTMGQFLDFGINQKNLDKITDFLTSELTKGQIPAESSDTFAKPQFLIDYRYAVLIAVLFIVQIIGYYLNYKDQQRSIPGNIVITFREGKTQDEMYMILEKYEEVGNCENRPSNIRRFICIVPAGAEEEIMKNVRLDFSIESVTRWHGE